MASIWTRTRKSKIRPTRLALLSLEDRSVPATIGYAGGTYANNFDWLPSAGTFTLSGAGPHFFDAAPLNFGTTQGDNTAPGWQLFKTGGSGTNALFIVQIPTSVSGSVYSMGAAAAADRTLGAIGSGTTSMTYGATFTNTSASTSFDGFTITLNREQWREGTAGIAIPEIQKFSYTVGSTANIGNGTFGATNITGTADLTAAKTGGAIVVDGNSTTLPDVTNPYQKAMTFSVTGINWLPGDNLTIRWTDTDSSSSDDGYGIDNFTFTANAPTGTATTTAITGITPPAVDLGDPVTFTATVTAGSGTDTPVGTVVFKDGTTTLASGPVTGTGPNGTVTINSNTVPPGTFSNIFATFNPTSGWLGSKSAAFAGTLTVNSTPTTLSLSSNQTNPTIGTDITFTAAVAAAGTPTGSVDFFANGFKINASPVALDGDSKATFLVPTAALQATGSLTGGINDISASYTPTGKYLPSSNSLAQRVKPNAFTAGNVLVYRTGDGANALSANGNRFFIDEYAPGAGQTSPLQSILMPTIASGGNLPVLASGQQSSEGQIAISPDGAYAYFTAYNAPPTNANSITIATAVAIPRVVGRLNLSTGDIDTSMALNDVASAGTFRGVAVAPNGAIYTTGSTGGVHYSSSYTPGVNSSTNLGGATLGGTAVSWTGLHVTGSTPQLFGATLANATGTAPKVATIGSGLPTGGTPAFTTFAGLPLGNTVLDIPVNPIDFYLADLSAAVDAGGGADTVYIAENGVNFAGGTITKWCWDPANSVWVLQGTINQSGFTTNLDNTYQWIAGVTAGTAVTLFITNGAGGTNTGGGTLWTVADSGGYNGAFTVPLLSQVAQVPIGSQKAFRGAAIIPAATATPSVTGFTVNNGAAQRSRLTTITVNFTGSVSPAAFTGLGAITLTRTAATPTGVIGTIVQTGATGANGLITVTQPGPANQLVLTFSNADGSNESAGVEYGSLADGRWQLAVTPSSFTSTLNDVTLRRLFGDFESGPGSNGTVDANDFAEFGTAFGLSGAPGFNPFDYDNNGTIDSVDLGAIGARFGFSV